MYLSIGVGRDAEGRLELLDDLREERHLEIGDVADGQQNPSVLLMQERVSLARRLKRAGNEPGPSHPASASGLLAV